MFPADGLRPHLAVGTRLRAIAFADARATLTSESPLSDVTLDEQNLIVGADNNEPTRGPAARTVDHQLKRHDASRGTAIFQVVEVTMGPERCWVKVRRIDGSNETVSFFEDAVAFTVPS
jgi:hypothetical protein